MMSSVELEQLVDEIREGRDRIGQFTTGLLDELQDDFDSDQQQWLELRSQAEQQQAELEAKEQRQAEFKSQDQRQAKELAELRHQLEQQQADLAHQETGQTEHLLELRQEIEHQKADLEQQELARSTAQTEADRLREDVAQNQSILDQAEQNKHALESQVQTLQAELELVRQREVQREEEREAERRVASVAAGRSATDPMEDARMQQMKQLQRDAARRRLEVEHAG